MTSHAGAPDAGRATLTLPRCDPTLASLRNNVFALACDAEYCHGAQSPAWNLWLLSPDVERILLTRRAGTCPDYPLVKPGDPDGSYLYLKVSLDEPPCKTERMPRGKRVLPAQSIACIGEWIASLPRGDAGTP